VDSLRDGEPAVKMNEFGGPARGCRRDAAGALAGVLVPRAGEGRAWERRQGAGFGPEPVPRGCGAEPAPIDHGHNVDGTVFCTFGNFDLFQDARGRRNFAVHLVGGDFKEGLVRSTLAPGAS